MATMKKTGKKDPGKGVMKGPYKSGLSKAAESAYPKAFESVRSMGRAISKAPMKQQGPKESGFVSGAKSAFKSLAGPMIKAGSNIKKKMQKPLPPSRSTAKRK